MPVFVTALAARAIDSAISATTSGGGDITLSVDQISARQITFTGALTAAVNVIFPLVTGDAGLVWALFNNTSGSFPLTVKAATGTGVAIAQGKRMLVTWDGTNVVALINDLAALAAAARGANTDITALTGITGGISMTGGLNVGGQVGGNSAATAPFSFGFDSAVAFSADANVTASAAQYSKPILKCTGAGPLATRDLILPLTQAGAVWMVWNALGVAQSIRVIGASGTGITIANNRVALVTTDATNFLRLTADAVLT